MRPQDDSVLPTPAPPDARGEGEGTGEAGRPPVAAFLGGPPPHLNDPHPMAGDPRFDQYRGRKRRRRPKSSPPPA
jgi:hypothetical protein